VLFVYYIVGLLDLIIVFFNKVYLWKMKSRFRRAFISFACRFNAVTMERAGNRASFSALCYLLYTSSLTWYFSPHRSWRSLVLNRRDT